MKEKIPLNPEADPVAGGRNFPGMPFIPHILPSTDDREKLFLRKG
jgi:hypothetical protein